MLHVSSSTAPFASLIALMAISAFATWLQATVGFGYALLAVPLVSFWFAPHDAIVIVFLDSCVVSLFMAGVDRESVQWDDTWRLSIAAIITMPIGAVVLLYVSGATLQLLLAALTAIVAITGLRTSQKLRALSQRWWHAWLAGAACGILTTSIATNGPPVVAYLQRRSLTAPKFRSTLSAVFTITNIVALVVFLVSGLISSLVITCSVLALPAVAAGYGCARWTTPRIDAQLYARLTNVLLLGLSAMLLWRGLSPST